MPNPSFPKTAFPSGHRSAESGASGGGPRTRRMPIVYLVLLMHTKRSIFAAGERRRTVRSKRARPREAPFPALPGASALPCFLCRVFPGPERREASRRAQTSGVWFFLPQDTPRKIEHVRIDLVHEKHLADVRDRALELGFHQVPPGGGGEVASAARAGRRTRSTPSS